MWSFVRNKQYLREVLLFCFNLIKNAAEARRLLEEAYSEHRKLPVKIGLNALKVAISILRAKICLEDQKQLRTPICKRYWMKMMRKREISLRRH